MRFEILGGVLGNQEFHIEEAWIYDSGFKVSFLQEKFFIFLQDKNFKGAYAITFNVRNKCCRYTDKLNQKKIANLQYHLLEIGTLTKNSLSPENFDCLPPLTELKLETNIMIQKYSSVSAIFWMKQIARFPI